MTKHDVIRTLYWTAMFLALMLWFALFLFAIPSLLVKWAMNLATYRYRRYLWRYIMTHAREHHAHTA